MSIEMTRVEWFTDSKMHEGTFENYQHQCSMFFFSISYDSASF